MLPTLFAVYLLCLAFIWVGKKQLAVGLLLLNFALCLLLLLYHSTDLFKAGV